MGTIILYLVLGGNAVAALWRPWIGIVLAFLIAILTPHNIWWWAFQSVRPVMWVLLPTVLGFGLVAMRGKLEFSGFKTRLNIWVVIFFGTLTLAYYVGPYVDVVNPYRFYDPAFMYSSVFKTFLTYFIAVLLIDDMRKAKWLAMVLVLTTVYMTYWANAQYFVNGVYGRVGGPVPIGGYSIYKDENVFAVLFVVGAPFVFYAAQYLQNRFLQWGAWLLIPFSWHAVFLTASRGALLAVGAVLMLFAWRSRSKALGAAVIVGFMVAFAWQAGDVMKSRSVTIVSYQEEESASGRIEAWTAATKMMLAHPLTGVGFASFGQAFPTFSESIPRIAHNTFFQVAGEQGVLGGLAYIIFTLTALNRLRRNGIALRKAKQSDDVRLAYCMNEACLLGFAGFTVCGAFLSLANYDIMYYLLILSNRTLLEGDALIERARASAPAPVSRWRQALQETGPAEPPGLPAKRVARS